MKKLAKGYGVTKSRFSRLSLVKFSCETAKAAERAAEAMSIIQHEWERSQGGKARRVFIEIFPAAISIKR